MRSMIDEGYSPANVDDAWKAFISGTNAIGYFGIWSLGDPALSEFEWGVSPMPVNGDEPGVWGSSHQFVVTKQVEGDENRAAAAAFVVNQLSTDSIEWAKANQVPARASVRESAEFTALTNLQPFAAQIDYPALNPPIPGLESSLDPINQWSARCRCQWPPGARVLARVGSADRGWGSAVSGSLADRSARRGKHAASETERPGASAVSAPPSAVSAPPLADRLDR